MKSLFSQQNKQNSSRLEKLQIKEQNSDLSWIYQLPNKEELTSQLQLVTFFTLQLDNDQYELEGVCHIYSNNSLSLKKICISKDFLIYEKNICLDLRDCILYKKKIHCYHNQLFLVVLENNGGSILMIFSHPLSQKEWFQILKKRSKQIEFLRKFRIAEIILQNFFKIVHKKKKKRYTAQIFNKKGITSQESKEIINNYIKILRSDKISHYMPVRAVYDDADVLYIITDQFIGNTFEQLFLIQKQEIAQVDLAFIIYSILQSIKSLQEEELYHGNICPENIILVNSQGKLEIYVINSNYSAQLNQDVKFYLNIIPNHLIAPETKQQAKKPSTKSDIYQLGIMLALISFFTTKQQYCKTYVINVIDKLSELINSQEIKFQKCQDSDYPYLFGSMQLDLMKKMLEPDPNKRITINEALMHTWFVSTREKLKPHKFNQAAQLPSLRTIIELVEQSEYDIKRKSTLHQQDSLVNRLQQATSICRYDYSPYIQDVSPLILQSQESFSEIIDEDHKISTLIDQLNNKNYIMLPSQISHYSSLQNSQVGLFQIENNLQYQ